jgi:hypothetical protein
VANRVLIRFILSNFYFSLFSRFGFSDWLDLFRFQLLFCIILEHPSSAT